MLELEQKKKLRRRISVNPVARQQLSRGPESSGLRSRNNSVIPFQNSRGFSILKDEANSSAWAQSRKNEGLGEILGRMHLAKSQGSSKESDSDQDYKESFKLVPAAPLRQEIFSQGRPSTFPNKDSAVGSSLRPRTSPFK